ncbi:MAG TPA: class I SAM-dependent methyltransferase [Chitinophagaceae bacterium]|jgi:ubiquinone/menaquinone biosynthesis C-methylase UbiE|nr:class I SAM-dependent methyltransferase [Chitinophagaceae bacterium]
MAKDLFSKQSDLYARYRPTYPKELYEYILSFVKEKNTAWDCATGNGQAAVVLASHFKKVIATDISAAQIEKAIKKENIEYSVCAAESTPFADNTFDLVTVAQAYHWIKWEELRKEATRVCKPEAIMAIWTYNRNKLGDKKIDDAVYSFYENITKPYWDYERKYVDELYETVEFDYELLPVKQFETILNWQREDMIGYISSWSAIQKYIKVNGHSPIPIIEEELNKLWPEGEVKKVVFPIYLKLGRIKK